MTTQITSKRTMYDLLTRGALGNALRAWSSPAELAASGYDGALRLRESRRASGLFTAPLPFQEAVAAWRPGLVLSEPAPHEHTTMNAEVQETDTGLYLRYRLEACDMRQAIERGMRSVWGLEAATVLRWALWPSSLADLQALLEAYPDHVVELTSYDVAVGPLRGRNANVWEVRAY